MVTSTRRTRIITCLALAIAVALSGSAVIRAESASAASYKFGIDSSAGKFGLEFQTNSSRAIMGRINCVRTGAYARASAVACSQTQFGALHTVRLLAPGIRFPQRPSPFTSIALRADTRIGRCTVQIGPFAEQPISCWSYSSATTIR